MFQNYSSGTDDDMESGGAGEIFKQFFKHHIVRTLIKFSFSHFRINNYNISYFKIQYIIVNKRCVVCRWKRNFAQIISSFFFLNQKYKRLTILIWRFKVELLKCIFSFFSISQVSRQDILDAFFDIGSSQAQPRPPSSRGAISIF